MKTIAKPIQKELKVKKSQFICRLYPIKNSKEAKEIISKIANEYNNATHNCSAFIAIDGEGFDDDGEPSGTAGKPMLNILKKNNLENILAIVTRYFGGIKLGAGGLVRTYSKSVLEAINIGNIVEMKPYNIYEIIFDYNNLKTVDNETRNYKLHILNKNFEDKVLYLIAIEKSKEIGSFAEKLDSKIKINLLEEKFLDI